MFRRQHAIVVSLLLPTFGVLSAACGDEEKATPQVIFDGRLELGGSSNNCKDVGELFIVGDFGNRALDPPQGSKPVKDGEAWDQGTASVACAVTPAGDGEFDVAASVALSGATGGLFRVDGRFKATGEQTGIHAIFSSRKSGNSYEQRDRQCIVRYGSTYQGVASGRVWGEITCPKVENPSAQTECEAIAQFRFENCAQ